MITKRNNTIFLYLYSNKRTQDLSLRLQNQNEVASFARGTDTERVIKNL